MSTERRWYYSLRCKGSNAWQHDGQTTKHTERIVNLGETPDCDIRFDDGDYRPEYYAAIVTGSDGHSWYLVRRSHHTDMNIEGRGAVGFVHQLSDGDILHFGNQPLALQFRVHHDNKYNDDGPGRSLWPWALIAGVVLLAGVLLMSRHDEAPISEQDMTAVEQSIYQLKVDSVQQRLVSNGVDSLLRPTLTFDDAPSATAFLTTDGRLLTARHCVEYWLGENVDLTTAVSSLADDDIVRWAIESETFNQHHAGSPDSVMQLRVFFSVYDLQGRLFHSFVSTDDHVHINTVHDGVFLLADFDGDYYWRSIRPYFVDKLMMLGDVLWIDGLKERGTIVTATKEQLVAMQRGTILMACGYPATGMGDKRVTFAQGRIKREVTPETENLCFESNINHGFSGGPVMAKIDGDIVAVGIVSRVDSVSSGIDKWAVPVSEVKSEK